MARHCLHNGLQAKAAGFKPILFPTNQNLGRSGRYLSRARLSMRSPLSIARHRAVHIACLNQIFSILFILCVLLNIMSVQYT